MAFECANSEIRKLSPILKSYVENVYEKTASFNGSKDTISGELGTAVSSFNNAYTDVDNSKISETDTQVKTALAGIALVKEATEILKKSVDGDVGAVITKCSEVDAIMKQISNLYSQPDINNWKPGLFERIWNEIAKIFTREWNDNQSGKISKTNEQLDRLMKNAEDQIKAIQESINAVKLGIIGNMKMGGSLGDYVSFDQTYSFDQAKWEEENPIISLNILQQAGCFALGAVEGVLRFGEGIVDTVATLVGGVITLFGGNADGIKSFVAEDWANKGASAVVELTSGITGVTADAYNQSVGRSVGKFVGQAIAVVAVTVATAGTGTAALAMSTAAKVATAVAMAGGSAESTLASGGTFGGALAMGALTGVGTYLVAGLGERFFATKVGQTLANGASKVINHPILSPVKFVGKVLTAPARLAAKAQASLISKVATGATTAVNGAISGVKNIANKFKTGSTVKGTSTTAGSSATPAQGTNTVLNQTDDALSAGRGSLGQDGKFKGPASQHGAPTEGNSVFNQPGASGGASTGANPNGSGASTSTGASTQGANTVLNQTDDALSAGRGSLGQDSRFQGPASQHGAPTEGNSVFNQPGASGGASTGANPNGAGASTSTGASTQGANTVLNQTDDALSAGRGSLGQDSRFQGPASQHGAPTQGNTIFNQMDDIGANTVLNQTDDALSAGRGSLGQDSRFQGPASQHGAPTQGNTIFNQMDDIGTNTALNQTDDALSAGRGSLGQDSRFQGPASQHGASTQGNTVLNQSSTSSQGAEQLRITDGRDNITQQLTGSIDDMANTQGSVQLKISENSINSSGLTGNTGVINTDDPTLLYKDALARWQAAGKPQSGAIYDDFMAAYELAQNNYLLTSEEAKAWAMHQYNSGSGVGTENLVYTDQGLQPIKERTPEELKKLMDLFQNS